MVGRIKLGLIALAAVLGLFFVLGVAGAQDKAKCDTCAEVAKVIAGMRCDGCKAADKACDHCAGEQKTLCEHSACKACDKDGKCDACTAAMKDAKCKHCAALKFILAHMYCCDNCAKESKKDCKKCDDKRAATAKAAGECKDCAKADKKG